MKRLILFICIVGYISFAIVNAYAVKYDLSIRERYEIWNGYNKKAYGDKSIDAKGVKIGKSNDHIWLQRIILGVHGHSHLCQYSIHFYDARVWGWSLNQNDFIKNKGTSDEYVMDPYEEYFELYDAYLEKDNILNIPLKIIFGRQKIYYGDKRIFGPGTWGNAIGWLWDAIRFSYHPTKNDFFDIWYGQTRTKDPDSFSLFSKHAYQGIGIYSHISTYISAIEPFFAWKNSLFYNNGYRENAYYFGCRLFNSNLRGFYYDFTIALERGRIISKYNYDKDIRAYGYAAKLGYTFYNLIFKPRILLGRIYASGDNNLSDSVYKTFSTPFGSTDGSHYGRLDLMSWGNMIDNQIDCYLFPKKYLSIRLALHRFYLANKQDKWVYYGYKFTNNRYNHIGDEFDIVLRYKFNKNIAFQTFYGYLFAGSFITKNDIAHNDASRWILQIKYSY